MVAACRQCIHGREHADQYSPEIELNDLTKHSSYRTAGGIVKWLLGSGFLSLSAAIFGFAAISLVAWNLITDPANIWVDTHLLRWGFFLGLQALIVVGLKLAVRLFHLGDAESAPSSVVQPVNNWSAVSDRSSAIHPTQTSDTEVEIAEVWASKWLTSQGRLPQTGQNDLMDDRAAENVPFSVVRIPSNEVIARRDPATLWPETKPLPVQRTPIDDQHIDDFPMQQGVDPLRFQLDDVDAVSPSGSVHSSDDWQWVEAAASAWLSRRQEEAAGLKPITSPEVTSRPAGRPAQDAS